MNITEGREETILSATRLCEKNNSFGGYWDSWYQYLGVVDSDFVLTYSTLLLSVVRLVVWDISNIKTVIGSILCLEVAAHGIAVLSL